MRKAWAARLALRLPRFLSSLPPDLRVPGHKLSHEVKCLTVFQGLISKPTSLVTVSKVSAPKPGTAKRSTPLFLYNNSRTSTPLRMRAEALLGLLGAGGSPAAA